MKVKQFTLNPFGMNCYIYYDENSGEGVIIDPAAFSVAEEDLLREFIKENNIKIKYIVNTHGHIDHILGNSFAKKEFGVPVLMHKNDDFLIENSVEQAKLFGLDFPQPPKVDEYLTEDSIIEVGGSRLKIIHTPGHSPGSVCLIDDVNKLCFCGDVIFKSSIGRTDLAGGDMNVLLDSIKRKLFSSCKDDYVLYPGHMEITNIGEEKKYNPFL